MKVDYSKLPFRPTHLDKVYFPERGYTKGDLFDYYVSVAEHILPYLRDRPMSLNRMPDGIDSEAFFQKNNPHLPDWVPHADIFSQSNHANIRWIVGGNIETLLYAVQLGSIEINPWSSRVGHLDYPDWIVIDLDPDNVSFAHVIQVANTVHDICQEWSIPTYPKTSGKTGLHIYIPAHAKYTYEQGKDLAHAIALQANQHHPDITSVVRDPAKRQGKIYVDYLQNRESQTIAAPYSVRPTPEATVSMPLGWDDVKPGLDPTEFTIKTAHKYLRKNPWAAMPNDTIDIPKIMRSIETLG